MTGWATAPEFAEAVQLVLETNRALSEESLSGKDVIREPLRMPRHREVNEFLAKKICRDLEVPEP